MYVPMCVSSPPPTLVYHQEVTLKQGREGQKAEEEKTEQNEVDYLSILQIHIHNIFIHITDEVAQ